MSEYLKHLNGRVNDQYDIATLFRLATTSSCLKTVPLVNALAIIVKFLAAISGFDEPSLSLAEVKALYCFTS